MAISQFIYLLVDKYLGCIHCLAIVNDEVVNMHVFIPLGSILKSEMAGS